MRDRRAVGELLSLALIIGIVFGLFLVGAYVLSYIDASTFNGRTYDVTVKVQAVEQSNRFYRHTNVWCEVYSGESLVYKLDGYVAIQRGDTYRIVFTNRMVWNYIDGFEVLGVVSQLECVQGGTS